MFCWKHKNWGFSPPKKEKKTHKKTKKASGKNSSKLALKLGPSMLRNKIGPVFNARNGSFVFVKFVIYFWKTLFFLQVERDFQNKKKQKNLF